MGSEGSGVRVDKWIWAARLYKTRSQATAACRGGRVLLNGQPARASQLVRPGDMVVARLSERDRTLEVVAMGERRGSAAQAALLFNDLTPPEPPREEPPVSRERGAGRPTKRQRRLIKKIFDDSW